MLYATLLMALVWWREPPVVPCSKVPIPVGRDSGATYFVGSATSDTLHAGVGEVRVGQDGGGGHWGPTKPRQVYGQVVEIGRLAGRGDSLLERAFRATGRRSAIIVPWDYDAGCAPVFWGTSARWIETEQPGFFILELRPERHWVGGIPVFDAFSPDLYPYPNALMYVRGYRGTGEARRPGALTPEEYFDVYGALPTWEEMQNDPAAAESRLQALERSRPDVVGRYPAAVILRVARGSLGRR